jgi:hypothetical protein
MAANRKSRRPYLQVSAAMRGRWFERIRTIYSKPCEILRRTEATYQSDQPGYRRHRRKYPMMDIRGARQL